MKLPGEHVFREKTRCPHCGAVMDAFRAADGSHEAPVPGDINGCVYCGKFAIFDDDLQLRAMTPTEAEEFRAYCSGFPKAVADAGIEEYRSTLVGQILREIFDRKEHDR